MECTVNWNHNNGMLFVASTGSGHVTVMDGAVEGGGNDSSAPRPMELLLAGTGGCAAYDVVLILKRGRHQVTDCQVQLHAERADTPKVFTKIHFNFVVSGHDLPEAAVERAVKLSHEKYCSASAMLGKTADMTYSVEIRNS